MQFKIRASQTQKIPYQLIVGDKEMEDEVYLTASTSEGFGLTLMEAVGSGLPMIGFDVPYGNQTNHGKT